MKKIALFSLFLFSLLIIGCSSQFNGDVEALYIGESGHKETNVKVYASSVDSPLVFYEDENHLMKQSIMTTALDNTQLDFYLFGYDKSVSNKSVKLFDSAKKVDFYPSAENDKEGIIILNFDVGYYDLFLAAVPKDKEFNQDYPQGNSVLLGHTSVDLRYETEIRFYLSSKDLCNYSGVYGDVSLSLYTENWSVPENCDVAVGIYERTFAGTKVREQPVLGSGDVFVIPSSIPLAANFIESGVKPGNYNFVVKFKCGNNVFYYADSIVVEPNRKTSGVIAIPDVIDKVPAAPSDFVAGYVKPKSYNESSYVVEFDWKDNANNEAYYQLELLDISSISNEGSTGYHTDLLGLTELYPSIAKDSCWESVKTRCSEKKYSDSVIKEFKFYKEGGLIKNSEHLVVEFPLGSNCIARICAVNDTGKSDYAYVNIYEGTGFSYNEGNVETWNKANNEAGINLYRISYDFNGGEFYEVDSDDSIIGKVSSKLPSFEYRSYSYSGNIVSSGKNIDCTPSTKCSIYYLNPEDKYCLWKCWGAGNKSYEDSFSYYGSRNLSLVAEFEEDTGDEKEHLNVHDASDTSFVSDIIFLMLKDASSLNDAEYIEHFPFTVDRSDEEQKCVFVVVRNKNVSTELGEYKPLYNEVNLCINKNGERSKYSLSGEYINISTDGSPLKGDNSKFSIPCSIFTEDGSYFITITALKSKDDIPHEIVVPLNVVNS